MDTIISFRAKPRITPSVTLVLVDLHEHGMSDWQKSPELTSALDNCRVALEHARAAGIPVAFIRRTAQSQFFGAEGWAPHWLPGFMPQRLDMLFERDLPSCYASAAFAHMMQGGDRPYTLAGLFAEDACLSTVIEAFHRHHELIYLADASACYANSDLQSFKLRRAVAVISERYGRVMPTREWIRASAHTSWLQP